MSYAVERGDVLDVLKTLPAESFDAMLTDPPYHLKSKGASARGFMGTTWDGGGVSFDPATWAEVLRVLKPGAWALVYGGTRTWHRLAVALEDAGFEIKDTLMWMYGQGFPKSHNLSRAIDKAAGAEREVLDVGQPVKRMIPGADQNRTGSWIKDNGREYVPTTTAPATDEAVRWDGYGTALKPAWEPILLVRKPTPLTYANNALEHGCGALNIEDARIDLNGESWTRGPGHGNYTGKIYGSFARQYTKPSNPSGRWPANVMLDEEAAAMLNAQAEGVSRFFYTPKASKAERVGTTHPTTKPLALDRYLARLLLPPPWGSERQLLVPFAGSGSELIAALQVGWDHVTGIELVEEYVKMIHHRVHVQT